MSEHGDGREIVAKAINRANWRTDAIADERWQDEAVRALMFMQADAALNALTAHSRDAAAKEGE